jgi:threonine/homoserine/homoserine lactone efflux protein
MSPTDITPIAAVIAALALGVISPGPSFVMVAREAVGQARGNGLAAALGMGLGGVLFALAALLGLQAVLLAVPALYLGLKVLGGLYLCWLGWRIFASAPQPLVVVRGGLARSEAGRTRRASLALGLATQLSNPKTAIVYASVFAALLPGAVSPVQGALLLCAVFVVEAGWYAVVALLLSAPAPRRAYLGCKTWVDRAAGAVMAGLGLRLVASAAQP